MKISDTYIYKKYVNSSDRSKNTINNILLSIVAKSINVVTPLLIVPMTINYVNPTQYGIWITLSSAIGWIHFFNLGLSNGFRNKFTEARANNDDLLARQYLSTTYAALTFIITILLIVLQSVNLFLDWSDILNIDASYKQELGLIISILCTFFCLNMVLNITTTMLTADQKPGYASLISGAGQICSLIAIYILTKVSTGSLTNLAVYFAGVPTAVVFIASIVIFNTPQYKRLSPRFKYIRLSLIKDIMGLGIMFFVIYLCLIAIFQLVNVAITREIGPIGVTQYNIAGRYFGILYSFMVIIINPFWSAFTDAYTKKDYLWMKNVKTKLEKLWFIIAVMGIVMLLISSFAYKIWIGDSVSIAFNLSVCVYILVMSKAIGVIYMYMINGIGTIRIQAIVYIAFALICYPTFVYACRFFGLHVAILVPALVYLVQGLVARIQVNKILNGTASGIWMK